MLAAAKANPVSFRFVLSLYHQLSDWEMSEMSAWEMSEMSACEMSVR